MFPSKFLSLSLLLGGLTTFAAVEEPIDSRFKPATTDPLIGDWQGNGSAVVQLATDEHGDYQANVLSKFDSSEAALATLRGQKRASGVTLRGAGWSATIENGHLLLSNKANERMDLARVTRPIATLGAKPPADAVILFDGKNLEAWSNKKGKEWLVEDGPAPWKIVDGNLEVVPGTGGGIISRQKFGDCHVHAEFRTLGAPSNSGIFLQTRYEVNINETYGQLTGTPNGGLDNSTTEKPTVRATRAPLEWQAFDIDFHAPRFDTAGKKTESARATVWLNGVKLYDQQELGPVKGAAGRLGEAPTGPIMLQEHGMPLQFRNIWVVKLAK